MATLRIATPIFPAVDLIDATVAFDALRRIPEFRPDLHYADQTTYLRVAYGG